MVRLSTDVVPAETDLTDNEKFEDITAELNAFIADKLEPM